ncbi:MAG: hypothetical protein AB7P04_11630 [Bacteriovoracia bacterium]
MSEQLKLISQPQAFFHELVTTALGNQKVSIHPETEFYLVNLLNQFMSTDNLYTRDANGNVKDEPLVFLFKEACETPARTAQRLMFRHVGDISLYVAGFFQESLHRKLVDIGYYIDIGGTAYQKVADQADDRANRTMYAQLSEQFGKCVDVLAEVSEKTTLKSETNLLRLYDNWVRTGSERTARILEGAGIIPTPNVKGNKQ